MAESDGARRAVPGWAVDAALLTMALFWATNMVLLKALLDPLPPPVLSALRFSMVSVLGLLVLAAKGGPWTVAREDRVRLLLSALAGVTVYQLLFMEGLDRTTAFTSNLIQGMEPVFVLVLLRVTGTLVPRKQWGGVLLAFGGAAIFFLQEAGGGRPSVAFGFGDLLNLLSSLSFAIYGLLSGPLYRRYPGHALMALTMSAGTLPLLPWAWRDLVAMDWSRLTPAVWAGLAFSSVLPVYAGYWIWNWAVSRKGLAHASLYLFVDILLTGVFAFLFLGERFGALRLAGAAVILLGVHLAREGDPPHPE
jgi:drug/metabolite transporter (DMT)-like permease